MSTKNLLILSYTFPPTPGIGGRRWAKFAKYLTVDHNYRIFILTNKNENKQISPWQKDTDTYRQNIFYFNNPYPSIINKSYYSFWDKIKYRIALAKLKAIDKGNYFDKTILLDTYFTKQVEDLIYKFDINNIIVTAGPFRWLSTIIQLKKKFPDIQFIADFRDPWTNNKTSFGYSSLTPQRLSFEQELEKNVIKNYNKVISVSPEMNEYFMKISGDNTIKYKFICIPNGFDSDDFSEIKNSDSAKTKLRFVFTGSLYDKTEHLIKALSEALKKIKTANTDLYHDLQFDFYGEYPKHFPGYFGSTEIVSFKGSIAINEVYNEINLSQVCMLFLTEDLGYSMSTKFYEYISQKKSILVFSTGSKTGEYVKNNQLGYEATINNIEKEIRVIHTDWKTKHLINNIGFDISAFDIKNITNSLAKELKS